MNEARERSRNAQNELAASLKSVDMARILRQFALAAGYGPKLKKRNADQGHTHEESEERLEAAMALKKQMWAEAQIDRRRAREDFMVKIQYPHRDDLASNHQENLGNNLNDRLLEPAYAAEKSRAQLKAFIGHKAEETYVYRSLPLGHDRKRNRYWQFITFASQSNSGSNRIFVELCDGRWSLIDNEESFNGLLASLDVRGNREAHLH